MQEEQETKNKEIPLLPYCKVVEQDDLKLALEVAYIAGSRIGGVLVSGHRGTGKSTMVRAFAQMMYGSLPITLPINATEDRVVGSYFVDKLLQGKGEWQEGLLVQANNKILYIDEVNLLDDHIVNIILDTAATGKLSIQRQGADKTVDTRFLLVGTMNPEEGHLRPQLRDRFGLMVQVTTKPASRAKILKTVLGFDIALAQYEKGELHEFVVNGRAEDAKKKNELEAAKARVHTLNMPDEVSQRCVAIAEKFEAVGHRGDYMMALAARALAAREGVDTTSLAHLQRVAPFVLAHRRPRREEWTEEDDKQLQSLFEQAEIA
ncbi:MAG: AAA family ATPase [Chloroflexi bacterium]|nr:AAA family ATPase [Chloroflexota bacterium]